MEYKKQTHCVYLCDYHIVFPTKYRRKVINPGIFAYLKLKIKEIGRHYPELEVKEINHDRDHIHILISIPPKMSVGNAVRIIKANTARSIRQKFPILRKVYWGSEGMWSDGYFVSTIGINESIIRRYIEEQGKEDAGQAKLELG
jgi:putative transposase